jgi:hypothetical protein
MRPRRGAAEGADARPGMAGGRPEVDRRACRAAPRGTPATSGAPISRSSAVVTPPAPRAIGRGVVDVRVQVDEPRRHDQPARVDASRPRERLGDTAAMRPPLMPTSRTRRGSSPDRRPARRGSPGRTSRLLRRPTGRFARPPTTQHPGDHQCGDGSTASGRLASRPYFERSITHDGGSGSSFHAWRQRLRHAPAMEPGRAVAADELVGVRYAASFIASVSVTKR